VRIRITRRGGLAGVPLHAEIDTDSLEPRAAANLKGFVEQLMSESPAPTPLQHPDAFVYEIAVPEKERSVSLGENKIPSELQPLLRELAVKGTLGK
jgi:hypothetical protein